MGHGILRDKIFPVFKKIENLVQEMDLVQDFKRQKQQVGEISLQCPLCPILASNAAKTKLSVTVTVG